MPRCEAAPSAAAAPEPLSDVSTQYVPGGVSKVQAPEKPEHTADLCIEAMDPVHDNQKTDAVNMLQKLEDISQFNRDNAVTSDRVACQQRKCRRLQRYPTYAT